MEAAATLTIGDRTFQVEDIKHAYGDNDGAHLIFKRPMDGQIKFTIKGDANETKGWVDYFEFSGVKIRDVRMEAEILDTLAAMLERTPLAFRTAVIELWRDPKFKALSEEEQITEMMRVAGESV